MSDRTAIEWADATWNPVTGCTKVSPGCAHCYAETMTKRFGGDFAVTLHPDRLEIPLRWRKPRRVFVVSMGDLFHEDVPDEFIDRVFAVMLVAQRHTFQVLTKRPARMGAYLSAKGRQVMVINQCRPLENSLDDQEWWGVGAMALTDTMPWPLPNVHLGVSVENQKALWRVGELMRTPAAVRFISAEPLLGPLDLGCIGGPFKNLDSLRGLVPVDVHAFEKQPPSLDWVIVGGESGGSEKRRLVTIPSRRSNRPFAYSPANRKSHPCPDCAPGYSAFSCPACGGHGYINEKPEALSWVRSIRDQCQAAGVPLFFKGWGGPTPKSGGRLLDGREWSEYP